MILRIFIAVMMLNASHMCGAVVLHPENDPLLTRKARTNAEVERVTSTSWSVWSAAHTLHAFAIALIPHTPAPEEVLRERLKGIVFPDGRDAEGKLVSGYRLPPVTEVVVDQDDMLGTIARLEGTMGRTHDSSVYCMALKAITDCASKGNKHALSTLSWLFASGNHHSRAIRWPHIDETRAALFRETAEESLEGSKAREEVYEVLRKVLLQGRTCELARGDEDKKAR